MIRGNEIYDNADHGIQLYPDAQHTTITGNVIDGNGQGIIFSGANGETPSNNLIEHNLITNSILRTNVESWYPAGNPIGTGNVVRSNCISAGVRDDGDGGIESPQVGFSATDNLLVDPLYVNREAKDFSLQPGSPCADVLAGGSAPAQLTIGTKRSRIPKGKRITFKGSAAGAQQVDVLVKKGGSWQSAATVAVSGSTYTVRVKARWRGHWSIPGHDMGARLPMKLVGTKTVPGSSSRERIGSARSMTERRRRT